MISSIPRARTAIGRGRLSRPLGLAASLLVPDLRILDYGCGRGDDVRRLCAMGLDAVGWDPNWRPDGPRRPSQLVNLGYVLNVIEDPAERLDTLHSAWALAEETLIVSALVGVETAKHTVPFGDGVLTSRGTFQKVFEQGELSSYIHDALGVEPVALGVGVFAVVRDAGRRAALAASRFRRRAVSALPKITAEHLFDAHRPAFESVLAFVEARGRLPNADDAVDTLALIEVFGSLHKALGVARKALPAEFWAQTAGQATEDLLVYLALAKFSGRPKISDLDLPMQGDIAAFFGSYATAKQEADTLLLSIGDTSVRTKAATASAVGKRLPDSLYVHASALDSLGPHLRVFEGCARRYVGTVDGANLIKLRLDRPVLSYLSYPDFDTDPHPALAWSLKIDLQTFRLRYTDYSQRDNPPILHRKEAFVAGDYPRRDTFARLTAQEEKWGLYAQARTIGTRDGWAAALARVGAVQRGHPAGSCSLIWVS